MERNIIPGIYNYCDRWCERCPLSSNCAVFERQNPTSEVPTYFGLFENGRPTPDQGSNIFQQEAKAFDLNLEHLALRLEKDVSDSVLESLHPIYRKSYDYACEAEAWVSGADLSEYAEVLNKSLELSIISTEAGDKEIETMKDCTRVIMWYAGFIHVKLSRALSSCRWADKWAEESGLQKDSDGSAKIALIAISKSIHSWQVLYSLLPSCEDSILGFLAALQRLEKLTNERFPKAMAFVRPGFDDRHVLVR